ncbi:trypsin-like serine protease [Chromobacterium phragmitis]|uniref:Trypsin-like serine protease n=1 Tax=Chromobacterium phragmitis TaxID=2202141 RepID=A0ABV0IUF4_9NEIS
MRKLFVVSCLLSLSQLSVAAPFSPQETNYIKLDFQNQNGSRNICGGSLVGKDLVLTASHCILDNWAGVTAYYGRNFENQASARRDNAQPNWIKFDHHGVAVDLALLKLSQPIAGRNGAKIVPVVAQENCASGIGAMQAQRRMDDQGYQLGQSLMQVSVANIVRQGPSPLANGVSLLANGNVGRGGDSGSPLLSPQGVQVGVYNGNAGNVSAFAALCKYASAIQAWSEVLSPSGAQTTPPGDWVWPSDRRRR